MAGTLFAVAAASLGIGYIWRADSPSDAATILGTVVAVLASAMTALRWLWSRNDAAPVDDAQDERVEQLARTLAGQWAQEAYSRKLVAPAPVELRWKLSEGPTAGSVASALAQPPAGIGPRRVPGVPTPDADTLTCPQVVEQLHRLYAGLPSGRLVLVGGHGTGKTSTLVLLLLAALRHREALPAEERRLVPVPAIVTLAAWNPASETLQDFVAESLVRDYPFLRSAVGGGVEVAEQLIGRGRVALLLDGFDEVPVAAGAAAIQAIDQLTALRIVVSTRPDEYAEATRRSRFHRSAVVEALPVTAQEAADYLLQEQGSADGPRWKAVADELLGNSGGPLAQALDTPWMLSLVKDAYPAGRDPGELADRSRFPTAGLIQEHLIDQMLVSAYSATAGSRRSGLRGYPAAEPWLEHIAHRMSGNVLVWSGVSEWVSTRTSRLVYGTLFGAITAAAALIALAPSTVAVDHAVAAAAWGLGGLTSYAVSAAIDQRVTGVPVVGMAFGIAGGALTGLLAGLALGLWLASHVAAAPALAAGLATGIALGISIAVAFVVLGMRNPRVAARRSRPAALGLGGVARPGALLMLAIACSFAALSAPESATLAVVVATTGISIGLLGDIIMSTQGDATPLTFSSPEASLRRDLAAWTMFGAVLGLANTLIFGFIFGSGVGGGIAWFGVSFLIALASSHASAFALAVTALFVTGRGPLRLLRFLRDAHRRQVLRRVGWAYQFRHHRVQERLAERHAVGAACAGGGGPCDDGGDG